MRKFIRNVWEHEAFQILFYMFIIFVVLGLLTFSIIWFFDFLDDFQSKKTYEMKINKYHYCINNLKDKKFCKINSN